MHLGSSAGEVITTDEVSKLLKMPRSTVTYKARQGSLPVAGKLPGRQGAYLFHRQQIEQINEGKEK
ncbi:helix-turn-helix domain-containing protein [Corynebacterium diphtheriae]|uniref:helix-turn-helix domain-containing protein n=1 Tax=Corynebacterium diphtheriae TaxID=1717 RepID=UPI0013C82C8C|nr:hypothetical protein FRC0405_01838 [Corynebacterium diphtheriae]CAB0917176.1 hypothetical protein FRC0420_02046 [Corynebacterium diphtheriae]